MSSSLGISSLIPSALPLTVAQIKLSSSVMTTSTTGASYIFKSFLFMMFFKFVKVLIKCELPILIHTRAPTT